MAIFGKRLCSQDLSYRHEIIRGSVRFARVSVLNKPVIRKCEFGDQNSHQYILQNLQIRHKNLNVSKYIKKNAF